MKKLALITSSLLLACSATYAGVYSDAMNQATSSASGNGGELAQVLHSGFGIADAGTNAGSFEIQAGTLAPITQNFYLTNLTVSYFTTYTNQTTCGGSVTSKPVDGALEMSLPKALGLDSISAGALYQSAISITFVHCIGITLTGKDAANAGDPGTSKHSNTRYFQVSCTDTGGTKECINTGDTSQRILSFTN